MPEVPADPTVPGYYLRADAVDLRLRTLVVFDTLNAYKERLFAGLVDGVGLRAELDVWFHHFNPTFMRKLLADARGKYDRYVVMPFVGSGACEALAALEQERLLVLDILAELPSEGCSWLVQNFDEELERALEAGAERFRRYQRIVYVDRPGLHNPEAIPGAVARFAAKHGLAYASVSRLDESAISPGSACTGQRTRRFVMGKKPQKPSAPHTSMFRSDGWSGPNMQVSIRYSYG